MKLYGIIESYQDYKGADATNWGVKTSLEDAKKYLLEIIGQQFHYIKVSLIDEIEDEQCTRAEDEQIELRWNEWVEDHLEEGGYGNGFTYRWTFDDGDTVYKFYIDELELPE